MTDFASRAAWGARVPTGPRQPTPVREWWIHWTVTRPTPDMAHDMHLIEAIGKQRFGRFSYSFCYHPPTRTIAEGAGYTIGAHTSGHNTPGAAISIIGMPGHDDFPHLVADIASFIRGETAAGRALPGAPIRGHRDQKATECPGAKAYALIPAIRAAVAAPAPLPQRPKPTPIPEPEETDDMAKPFTLKATGTASGKVKNGQVWLIDPNAATAHRPNIKSDVWRERLDALIWTGVVENREDKPVPCSYIDSFRKV